MENGNGAVLATTADLQGRFTFKGTLPVSMEEGFDANGDPATVKNGFRALVTDVTAQDEAGPAAKRRTTRRWPPAASWARCWPADPPLFTILPLSHIRKGRRAAGRLSFRVKRISLPREGYPFL